MTLPQRSEHRKHAASARTKGKLAGRIALITGAGRGLGGAIALDFAKAGADIVICDIDMPALEETCEAAVNAAGVACLPLYCDISSSSEVADMFASIVKRFGTLDILVNNAADAPTTVHGMFYCTREALKLMEAQHYGRIVNLASIAGFSAISAHSPHYSATKGAVIAFTKSVAAEVAGGNILVNALAPGAGRFGTMQEYASMATYLAGDHCFVGQVISPNGGAVI